MWAERTGSQARCGARGRVAFAARALVASALLSACASSGKQLRLEHGAPQSAPPANVAELGTIRAAPRADPALALGSDGVRLLGAPLDVLVRWEASAPKLELGLLATPLVLTSTEGELSARAAPTGNVYWGQSSRSRLLAAAATSDGASVLVLAPDDRGDHRLLVLDAKGRTRLTLTARERIGVSMLAGERLYVPWGGRHLSVIDLVTARELARFTPGPPVEHVVTGADGGLYLVSGLGYVPVSEALLEPRMLPSRPLPGGARHVVPYDLTPFAPRDPTPPEPKLVAEPARVSERHGHYLYVHGRLVLGLSLADANIDWVRVAERRVLGAAALASGFLLCDAGGVITLLADDGSRLDRLLLGPARLDACALSPGRVRAPEQAPVPPPPFVTQLAEALRLGDDALVPAQRLLLAELERRPEPAATRLLLEVASSPTASLDLQRDAGALLAERRNGVDEMLEVLARPVTPGAPAPVAALADALAAMGELRATPLLARHLREPTHTEETLEHVALALEKLATPAEQEPLRVFFMLQRATVDEDAGVRAVLAVARTLLAIGGGAGRATVELAARDPLTVPLVRSGLTALLADTPAPTDAPGPAPPP